MSILADQVGEGIEEGCIHEDRSADASWPFILLLGFSQMEWQILLAMSITTVTSTKFVLHILSFFFSKSSSEWFSWSSTINRYESNVGVSDFYGKKESDKSYDLHHITIKFFFLACRHSLLWKKVVNYLSIVGKGGLSFALSGFHGYFYFLSYISVSYTLLQSAKFNLLSRFKNYAICAQCVFFLGWW